MANLDEVAPLSQEVEDYLTSMNVDDETRFMCRKYYPLAWNKPSTHLQGGIVQTWQALMMHARGEEEARVRNARLEERELRNARKKRQAKTAEQSAEWVQWHRDCTARKAWIEGKVAEWRRRVAERKASDAQWDAYVEQARLEMQAAKATAVPAQPGTAAK